MSIALLPRNFRRKELREEIIVVELQLFHVRLRVALGIEVVHIELVDPLEHLQIVLRHEVSIGAVPMS